MLAENEDSWILSFTYNHSTHQVTYTLPKTETVATDQSANPSSTLTMPEWIVACIVALAILLVVGLLLLDLRSNSKQ